MSYTLRAAALGVCLCAGTYRALPAQLPFGLAAFEQQAKAAAVAGIPTPAQDLAPVVNKYKATIQAGGQTLTMDITDQVKDQAGMWAASNTSETPLGEANDTVLMDKGTLVLRERHIRQGPLSIDLVFAGDKATGKMTMAKSGESRPVDVDLGGPLFGDSAGALESFAALPLADGYKTTFRNFDLQYRKPKLMELSIVGSETVTVPAGTFECWKLEVGSADSESGKTTIWIAKAQRKAVKYTASSPQQGGQNVTAELLP
ncbi:MAG: DUF3108 domain-containing protein [Acidobacteriaceae bacterium]|nr:DUF3108 domain-containing protein [Acidobacteriaceae bacterium]